jgi:hypothetical protein
MNLQEKVMTRASPRPLLGIAAGALLVTGAFAQTSPPPASSNPPPPAADQSAPRHFDAQADNRSNESLSQRLDRTDGVIRPPAHVDPKIQETPPPTGDRGVVLPPSSGVTPK